MKVAYLAGLLQEKEQETQHGPPTALFFLWVGMSLLSHDTKQALIVQT